MKTLGEFYREDILPHKPLIKKELPTSRYGSDATIKIERHLFGWKLYCGKNFIECRSEEEARYCKVFLEAGEREIKVPKSQERLKAILPELERLKTRIGEIIEENVDCIFPLSKREQIRHRLWSAVMTK